MKYSSSSGDPNLRPCQRVYEVEIAALAEISPKLPNQASAPRSCHSAPKFMFSTSLFNSNGGSRLRMPPAPTSSRPAQARKNTIGAVA